MPDIELETALAAARGLARLVAEEYDTGGSEGLSFAEIARTWTPYGMTREEIDPIGKLEAAGGFAGVGDGS